MARASVLAALLLAGCASTPTPEPPAGEAAVPVRDAARAAAFYRDVLGFREAGGAWERGGTRIRLEAPHGGDAAVVVLRVKGVVAFHDEVAARWKGPVGVVVKGPGGGEFEVRDPDGNLVRVVEAR